MIAYVTSVGEETTDLCMWALLRNGFDAVLIQNSSSLADKLEFIYNSADTDFVRVDADVIVNRYCTPDIIRIGAEDRPDAWWIQFRCWGWYNQAPIHGGVQYIKKEAIPALQSNIKQFKDVSRPETGISRINEFYDPRRFVSSDLILGLHGYGIKDIKPIIRQKAARGQSANYDFELTKRLNELS